MHTYINSCELQGQSMLICLHDQVARVATKLKISTQGHHEKKIITKVTVSTKASLNKNAHMVKRRSEQLVYRLLCLSPYAGYPLRLKGPGTSTQRPADGEAP